MTKIMLVEDDNNLREIYEARLAAEGYSIVSAQDGEAALALAAKERPDLIITDVMMPKISGFEMLDILRNTEGLKDVKVIMLTALGQAEDNARAGALGADRYLVKSQVTLEDIVKAAHDVVQDESDGSDYTVSTAPAVLPEPANQPDPTSSQSQPTGPSPAPAEPAVSEPAEDAPQPSSTDDVHPESPSEPEQSPSQIDVVPPPEAPHLDLPEVPDPTDTPELTADTPSAPASDDTTSDAPSDDDTTDDTLATDDTPQPETQEDQPRPQADVQAAEAEQAAEPASQEESTMRAQIDQFIGDSSDSSNDIQPPPDEDDAEYDKDDQTPDMGELSVQTPEEPAQSEAPTDATPADSSAAPAPTAEPAAAPAPVSPAPGYPSQPYELPAAQGAAISPEDQPSGAQQPLTDSPATTGDKVVSDAIDDLIANSPGTPPVPGAQPAAVNAAPQLEQQGAAPTPPPPSHQSGGSMHTRLVTPLQGPPKPDINQLLSMEEAKAAASAAATQTAPPAGQPPQPPNTAPPINGGQQIDPNSISL